MARRPGEYQTEQQGKWMWGWKCQARCVPDVDAEDGLRRRQTIGSGQTPKKTAERKRRSEWGSREFQRYWMWLLVLIHWNLRRITTDFKVYREWSQKERNKKCEHRLFTERKIFLALCSAKSRHWNTAARRTQAARLNSNCLQRVKLPQQLDACLLSAGNPSFSTKFLGIFSNRYDGFVVNESKITKSHTAKTDKAD